MNGWELERLVRDGMLMGARFNPETGEPERVQEGRLGYEEYAARGAALRGLDTSQALRTDNFTRLREVYDIEMATDSRSARDFGANTYLVSEPYILMALEMGLDRDGKELAHRMLQVQEQRYLATGTPTAVSEDHLDREPFFAYNSVFSNGREWIAMTENGDIRNDIKILSTKAAFAWDMIYDTAYTNLLKEAVLKTATSDKGWYAGIYDADGSINAVATANTNGIILEALHFKAFGPMMGFKDLQ